MKTLIYAAPAVKGLNYKQLPLFTFARQTSTALQSQKAATAYLWSKQLLPFGFARQTSSDLCNYEILRSDTMQQDQLTKSTVNEHYSYRHSSLQL